MSAGNSVDGASASSDGQFFADRTPVLRLNDGTLVQNRCITIDKEINFTFAWTIANFTSRKEEERLRLDSFDFSFGSNNELQWRLEVRPEVKDLSVDLQLVRSSRDPVPTKFEISILNDRNEKAHIRRCPEAGGFTIIGLAQSYYRFKSYIKFDVLLNKANRLLPDDSLTFLCEGTSILIETKAVIYPPSCQPQICTPKCTLLEKFGSLFENEELSDFTLSVEGKDLPVHKVILAAQSSVFAAMFKHEMEENKQNRVTIEDIDYDVLREMLLYIYTGKTQNLDKMARELLVAADKYDVSGLKEICGVTLGSTLTAENAVDLLALAETYLAKQLKTQVINFISTHAKDVMVTSGWKNMNSYPPSVIVELFEAIASK